MNQAEIDRELALYNNVEDSEDDLVDSGELLKVLEQEQGGIRWVEGGRVWKQDE